MCWPHCLLWVLFGSGCAWPPLPWDWRYPFSTSRHLARPCIPSLPHPKCSTRTLSEWQCAPQAHGWEPWTCGPCCARTFCMPPVSQSLHIAQGSIARNKCSLFLLLGFIIITAYYIAHYVNELEQQNSNVCCGIKLISRRGKLNANRRLRSSVAGILPIKPYMNTQLGRKACLIYIVLWPRKKRVHLEAEGRNRTPLTHRFFKKTEWQRDWGIEVINTAQLQMPVEWRFFSIL